jgi:hypothetical protein
MNEAEKRTILVIARTHKHMCISINTFTDFLSDTTWNIFQPIILRASLMLGHYGNIYKCNIWVSKRIKTGHVSISDLEIVNSKNEDDWSPQVLIEDSDVYKRIIKLKAFW